jgi:hypothetical protein
MPRNAVALQRQQEALELRRAGLGYIAIADRLGISKSQSHRLVQHALAEAKESVLADAVTLQSEEVSRLDGLLTSIWPNARQGNLGAIDRVLKIMERRSKMLGLDAPQRFAHGGDDKGPPIGLMPMQSMTDEELMRLAQGLPPGDPTRTAA